MRSPRANLRKRYSMIAGAILILYLYISSGFKTYTKEGVIENSNVEDVWLFLSDFSQLKTINPTILDFAITADHGNREHWRYSVDYTEQLSHWPHLINYNKAHIAAKTTGSSAHLIESKHSTCFLGGLYCLHSEGLFELDEAKNGESPGTQYRETARYQCPPLMGWFCKREVAYQREVIFQNLRQHFHRHHRRG